MLLFLYIYIYITILDLIHKRLCMAGFSPGLAVKVDNYWGYGARITVAVPPPKPSYMALYEVHLPCTSATIESVSSLADLRLLRSLSLFRSRLYKHFLLKVIFRVSTYR